ncbi:hypothetical protein FQR65_LT15422 [Abscondita terminalis]|nr:hypothetical protein FQR65_LT15422 [Abscondita terminalis]
MKHFTIIGGGVAGLTAAIGLQQIGIQADVYEGAPVLKGIGAGFGLAANAMQALEYLGLKSEATTDSFFLPRYSGYHCWRATIDNSTIQLDKGSETWGAKGRFGMTPLVGNKIYWYACINTTANNPLYRNWNIENLRKHFASYHHPIPQILNETEDKQLIWNDIIDIKPLDQLAFGNILLLGDAGHATTPNMGQGACQAIEDVAVLIDELKKDISIAQAFVDFEKRRLSRTRYITETSWTIGKIAQWQNPALIAALLIVDDVHEVLLEKLQDAGIAYDYQPDITRAEAEEQISEYSGLVIRSKFQVDSAFMDLAPGLSFIARAGAGMDNIDEAYAASRDNYTGSMHRRKPRCCSHQQIKNRQWLREENRGYELKGRTVALIGYGNNGQAMAKKLSGFDVNVIAYDKYKTGFSDEYAREVSMEEVVKYADVLSFHIPLTRETKGMVDEEYLFHFRKPIFFLMGARGGIVDIPAVLRNLDSGRIIAAAFDVLPVEKFPSLANNPGLRI